MARDKRFRYDWTPERDAALIEAGLLAATAMTPNNPQAQSYQVTPQALRRFCLTHTQRLMQLHPDIVWYTDLISGGKKPASTGQHPLPLEIAHAA